MSEENNEELAAQTVKKNKPKRSLLSDIIQIACILIVLFVIFNYVLMSVKVNGTSMLPTYRDGDRGIMYRYMGFNKPKCNDVVVINYDWDYEQEYIVKRIIGVPGDKIEIRNNQVYINDKPYDDSHRMPDSVMENMPPKVLREAEYFVLGDNRDVSKDSRYIGVININKILAVSGFVYWPLNDIKLMH